MADFRASLSGAAPAPELEPPLAALWWAAKGDWNAAHKIVQDENTHEAAWAHAYLHRDRCALDLRRYADTLSFETIYQRGGRPPEEKS